jgi:hypothetical protein
MGGDVYFKKIISWRSHENGMKQGGDKPVCARRRSMRRFKDP